MAKNDPSSRRLDRYREKRRFDRTSEPKGSDATGDGALYVVQKHSARQLHYDLRLQFGDVLKSWAISKGPSLNPKVRRLAVHVEEHPIEYARFEGTIPKGEYGGGSVLVWDVGSWVPMDDPTESFDRGIIKFRLAGEKLKGGWSLIQLKENTDDKIWLLIKERDIYADREGDILQEKPLSVLTGRAIEEIGEAQSSTSVRKKRRPLPRPSRIDGATRAPLPHSQKPQLPTLVDKPPAGADWLHEIKYDGYRTLCRIENGQTRLFTRNGHDWTDRYQPIASAFAAVPCKSAMIDGEIGVQDANGVMRLSEIQEALSDGATERLLFYAFDLLHLNGYDLTPVGLVERKSALEALLDRVVSETSPIQFSDHIVGSGLSFFDQAAELNLEGIVSKKAKATYSPGRSNSWVKVKCVKSDDFVIVGYTVSRAAGGLASLLVAEPTDSGLRYVGKVGTGFSANHQAVLQKELEKDPSGKPLLVVPKGSRSNVNWVQPRHLAEIEYGARTSAGRLRAAVFKGLRPDKGISEKLTDTKKRKRYMTDSALASVWMTNPDRAMFGLGGPTKLDIALYYAKVGDWILPEIERRPITLIRCPTGEVEDCFYQRHAGEGMPKSVHQLSLDDDESKSKASLLYIESAEAMLALCQFGVVEFHPWGCRIDKPESPDRLIFDLDPDVSVDWREVVNAANEIREELAKLSLTSFVKTTGGKGLHVVVPIQRRVSWQTLKGFSGTFSEMMSNRSSRRYTSNQSIRSRKGKIYIDYLRNVRGATAAAAYTIRARPGAPVATPLDWNELQEIDGPEDFNYATVPDRLARLTHDPWEGIDTTKQRITRNLQEKLA